MKQKSFLKSTKSGSGDNVINKNIRSLNMQQKEIVIFVPKWLRDFIKSLGWKKRIEMLNHFIYLLRVEQGLESLI